VSAAILLKMLIQKCPEICISYSFQTLDLIAGLWVRKAEHNNASTKFISDYHRQFELIQPKFILLKSYKRFSTRMCTGNCTCMACAQCVHRTVTYLSAIYLERAIESTLRWNLL
jgi:hypothetical protein